MVKEETQLVNLADQKCKKCYWKSWYTCNTTLKKQFSNHCGVIESLNGKKMVNLDGQMCKITNIELHSAIAPRRNWWKESCLRNFRWLTKSIRYVNHNILLTKLHRYGIREAAYDWCKSYLSNRYHSYDYAKIAR